MELGSFDALSFDCYGTLIDWESGIAAVLGPWARVQGLDLDDEALLAAYSGHEARAEAEHPGDRYPLILARSFHDLGRELGAEAGLPTVWINRRHGRPGWGATPAPAAGVSPDAEFPSMQAFADAAAAR